MHAALYGLKQDKAAAFDADLTTTMASEGFFPIPSNPKTFHKLCPLNPLNSLSVTRHVDDGAVYRTSDHLLEDLKTLLSNANSPTSTSPKPATPT
jgi:hypothetical protein